MGTNRWFVVWGVLLIGVGCREEQGPDNATSCGQGCAGLGGNTGSAGKAGASQGPPPGMMGGSCKTHSDCSASMRCVEDLGGTKVCGPACKTTDDCKAFASTSYAIKVPADVYPQGGEPTPNAWRSETLARAYNCVPAGDGETGTYCGFVCPHGSSATLDKGGQVTGCTCLPHYKLTPDKTGCIWDDAIQCALLPAPIEELTAGKAVVNPCDACNSEPGLSDALGCHTGVFGCDFRDTSFNGSCAELISAEQLNACNKAQTNFECTCDSACINGCGNYVLCWDQCCPCKPTSSPPSAAICGGAGGASGAGGSTGSAGNGGGMGGKPPENTAAACTDSADNDGDTYIDCEDKDCCAVVACPKGTYCGDQGAGGGSGVENTAALCSDKKDNDGDTYIDCEDKNCCAVVACPKGTYCGDQVQENTVALCSDGQDNDGDTYIDCEDKNCCGVIDCSSKPSSYCATH